MGTEISKRAFTEQDFIAFKKAWLSELEYDKYVYAFPSGRDCERTVGCQFIAP